MRLGPALLVALLPLLAGANITSQFENSLATVSGSKSSSVQFIRSKPTSPATSKTSSSSSSSSHNTIPLKYEKYNEISGNFSAENDDDMWQTNGPPDESMEQISTEYVPAKKDNLTAANLKAAPLYKKKNITVGYLTAARGELKERQGLSISGALTLALEEINESPDILPNVTLVLRWNDTKGETLIATRAITEMICDGVSVFFGPEGQCYVEAVVAQSRNIPMISYKCSDPRASHVKTFARTEPPDTQVTKSVVSLLKYYNWMKFSIIYEEGWQTVATSLVNEAKVNNMTVNDVTMTMDRHKCCEDNLSCCLSGFWYQFIQNTKNRTRSELLVLTQAIAICGSLIFVASMTYLSTMKKHCPKRFAVEIFKKFLYVFIGTAISLIDLMNTMQTAQLFDKGEYIVIYVDTHQDKNTYKYLWKPGVYEKKTSCSETQKDFMKRARSLLVVVPTAPSEHYEHHFTEKVREYSYKDPFNFKIPRLFNDNKFQKFVSIYAAYLYDSVKLYAKALDTLLKKESLLDDEKIEEIASNGTKIIDTVIQLKWHKSITGAIIRFDDNGDSEGNFTVLALGKVKDEYVLPNFTCPYQMVVVAQFQQSDVPVYTMSGKNRKIAWVNGNPPNDEPICGFNNELCKKIDTHLNSIIAAGVLAVMLFCAGVITMSIYRKWKIEQEIEGLLWKIDRNDIHGYFERDVIASPSRMSLVSASVTSYESRGGAQVFARTAQYRNVVVRIKDMTFSRRKDISRDVMKEMRLLRDLRHDNINSFIGACVEPTSLLLVTDYCSKGSLYDIIENEDIKLDKMFIASLIHDLIKGMLYIHNSMLICHGNLKSSNCVVTSRWVLQVTDFGLAEIRHCAENDSIGEHQYYRSLFWKAPELLRHPTVYLKGTPKGDVYAFAIILYEIIGRKGPFGNIGYEPKDIIELVKRIPLDGEEPFRPEIDLLLDSENCCEDYIFQCMKDCWAENPDARPDFSAIRVRLKKMKDGKNRNIMDQMMEMMVKYADHLEDLVTERTRLLYEEKMKTEDLLHRMLPKPVAERLTMGYGIEPEWFDLVTIYFSDIVGFTAMSAESTPLQVVNFLNDLYTVFDRIIKGYDVYKVETIGDAYMVVSGLPLRNGDKHAGEIASMSLELLSAVKNHHISHRPKETLKLRIGVHTGPVVAGVVGLTMPRYCLFGDTVNTASRMESNGEPLKIHISMQCKDALEKLGGYVMEDRGLVNMKGKGEVRTFWLSGATEKAIQKREVDLAELPPLFCRPRRSPKLNNDSRQASFCAGMGGFGGMNSRRQSSVPRGTSIEVESTSTIHNSSPLPNRHTLNKLNRHALHVPDTGSKLTVNSTFGSQVIEPNEMENRRGLRSRRVLSSIASSCDEPNKSIGTLNKVRESKSLDLLPLSKESHLEQTYRVLQEVKRSTRSLENDIQIIAIPDDKLLNNNFPNGNIVNISHEDNSMLLEDVNVPLLHIDGIPTITHRKRFGSGIEESNEEHLSKRCKSLESVPVTCGQVCDDMQNKKHLPRHSIKTWFVGLFNGNGLRASNTSLRKEVLNEYNNLQAEKESIV